MLVLLDSSPKHVSLGIGLHVINCVHHLPKDLLIAGDSVFCLLGGY